MEYPDAAKVLNTGNMTRFEKPIHILKKLKRLIKRTRTPWLSDHLCWGSVDGRYTHDHPVIDPVWKLYARAIQRSGKTATLLEWDDHIPSFDEVHHEALKANRFILLCIVIGIQLFYKQLRLDQFALGPALRQGAPLEESLAKALKYGNASRFQPKQITKWFQDWSALGWFCHRAEETSK